MILYRFEVDLEESLRANRMESGRLCGDPIDGLPLQFLASDVALDVE